MFAQIVHPANRGTAYVIRKSFFVTKCIDIKSTPHHKVPLKRRIKMIPVPLYGGKHMVTMIPGVGTGPELMGYVRDIFSFIGAPVHFEVLTVNPKADSEAELDNILLSVKRNRVALTTTLGTHLEHINVELRRRLGLFMNFLHCKSYPGVKARRQNVDIILIRQNTEGEYKMLEHENRKGVVESLKIITEQNSRRLARWALNYARKNGRKKITAVHKANIMKLSDGLFLQCVRDEAKKFPDIKQNDMIVDNCCMQLVSNPYQFDVMIMPNLYGMILANVVCGMSGGPGLYAGENIGRNYAVFETGLRTAGLKLAGKNVANPIAILNASAELLEYLGHCMHYRLLKEAIRKTLCEDTVHTADIGGKNSSTEVIFKVKDNLKNLINDKKFLSSSSTN